MTEQLEIVHSEIMTCTKCELHIGRTRAVPGEGPVGTPVMLVGEGPGEREDEEGRPFVGAAGKLLAELLASIGLDRDRVFITNIVKCRPPHNRPPRQGEVEACNPYLQAQIRLVDPRIICPLGTPAIKTVLGQEYSAGLGHGKPVKKEGRIVLPLYHPAAALYDPSLKELMLKDFKILKGLIDEEARRKRPPLSSDEKGEEAEPLHKWL